MTKQLNLEDAISKTVEFGRLMQESASELAKVFEGLQLSLEQIDEIIIDDEELKLGDIHFSSNHSSWKMSKDSRKPFYYESSLGADGHGFGEFTLEEAEQLVEFLTEKINYLKS